VVHEDNRGLLAVYKPPSLPTKASKDQQQHSLHAYLEHAFPSSSLHLPSRLDVATSGLILCSAKRELNNKLQQCFEKHIVQKEYLFLASSALVAGAASPSTSASGRGGAEEERKCDEPAAAEQQQQGEGRGSWRWPWPVGHTVTVDRPIGRHGQHKVLRKAFVVPPQLTDYYTLAPPGPASSSSSSSFSAASASHSSGSEEPPKQVTDALVAWYSQLEQAKLDDGKLERPKPSVTKMTCLARFKYHPATGALGPVLKEEGAAAVELSSEEEATGVCKDGAVWVNLIHARPLTGRTHQIRVHASSLGFPIVGTDRRHTKPSLSQRSLASLTLLASGFLF